MANVSCCPRCHAEVSADAPDGLCPECLLRQVIDGRAEEDEQAAGRSPAPRFVPPAPAELARHFPQLGVLELLGQGGMGAVYKARQMKLDRLVAIKILPPEVARDPAFAERFLREARSLARLNHPNIVTVHDFGDVDGLYHFTMEYVDGQNLRDLLQNGPLPAAQVQAIVAQVCDALQFAHDEGLIHRDIKPENILLDRKGRVKIADFGLAKLVGLTPAYLTLTGTHEVMGTLLYMAPEQMMQAHTVDHRADLYSLGVVLYEMLTGELPLGRFAPPSRKAAVDEGVDQVVLRALAREPAERYQDAGAFKQDVEATLAAVPSREGQRLSQHGKPTWPCVRFLPCSAYVPGGLLSRDDEALIVEFELAPKGSYRARWQQGVPQEVRIPPHEIASLAFGWGWGKPPCSLILRVNRLTVLAGISASNQGQLKLRVPREDREEARRLVESFAPRTFAGGRLGSGERFEHARAEVGAPALGLLATGVLTFLFWPMVLLILMVQDPPPRHEWPELLFWLTLAGVLLTWVSVVLIMGAVQLKRLRGYPLAAMAAILAMIPWSPAWLIGFPFGIWTCIVLGRPPVAEAFLSDKRQLDSLPSKARKPSGGRNRFLALVRSVAGYILPTMAGGTTNESSGNLQSQPTDVLTERYRAAGQHDSSGDPHSPPVDRPSR
jgi:serine/threonine protein kinase